MRSRGSAVSKTFDQSAKNNYHTSKYAKEQKTGILSKNQCDVK